MVVELRAQLLVQSPPLARIHAARLVVVVVADALHHTHVEGLGEALAVGGKGERVDRDDAGHVRVVVVGVDVRIVGVAVVASAVASLTAGAAAAPSSVASSAAPLAAAAAVALEPVAVLRVRPQDVGQVAHGRLHDRGQLRLVHEAGLCRHHLTLSTSSTACGQNKDARSEPESAKDDKVFFEFGFFFERCGENDAWSRVLTTASTSATALSLASLLTLALTLLSLSTLSALTLLHNAGLGRVDAAGSTVSAASLVGGTVSGLVTAVSVAVVALTDAQLSADHACREERTRQDTSGSTRDHSQCEVDNHF